MSVTPDSCDISIQDIANKAGIGKGSIYYYFRSKDEITDSVVERCYKKALQEYFSDIDTHNTALEKIKCLFKSIIKKEFKDRQKNFIIDLNLHDDLALNNKMKIVAIETVAPVLAELLVQGKNEGTINTDTPEESAEMIVASVTLLFDSAVFTSERDAKKILIKLKILAKVLETSFQAPTDSFNFLFEENWEM